MSWAQRPPTTSHCALHLHQPWRRTPSAPSVWACGSVWAPPAAWAGRSAPTLPSYGCRELSAASPAGSPAHTAETPPSPSWWILTGPSPTTSRGRRISYYHTGVKGVCIVALGLQTGQRHVKGPPSLVHWHKTATQVCFVSLWSLCIS